MFHAPRRERGWPRLRFGRLRQGVVVRPSGPEAPRREGIRRGVHSRSCCYESRGCTRSRSESVALRLPEMGNAFAPARRQLFDFDGQPGHHEQGGISLLRQASVHASQHVAIDPPE